MSIDIKVPVLPESVADANIATWHKKPGEFISRDESLVDIETDKVVLEVVAPEDGYLETILKDKGDTVHGEEVIAIFKAGQPTAAQAPKAEPVKEAVKEAKPAAAAAVIAPAVAAAPVKSGPAARRKLEESGVQPAAAVPTAVAKTAKVSAPTAATTTTPSIVLEGRGEKRVPMSRLRTRIAERLLQSQQTAAILTTFNEINMKPVMDLRNKYKEAFEKVHGVKLGFMSFFARAVVEALRHYPIVNASIDGQDIIYHQYMDLGVAVSTERGLVVPVLRNADQMSLAELEKGIINLGRKAKDNALTIEDMTGGTFTLSNGGVFGSLMSTPIINPPQTGILGMHKIQERPVVENGEIVIRPMMYVALSYDHRLIDGADSVRFLVTIKECLEDPARLILEI